MVNLLYIGNAGGGVDQRIGWFLRRHQPEGGKQTEICPLESKLKIIKKKGRKTMKKWKKLSSLLLAFVMVLTMAMPVMAAAPSGNFGDKAGTITIKNAEKDRTYNLYKIFDLSYAGEGDSLTVAYRISDAWVNFFTGDNEKYIVDNNNDAKTLATVTVEVGGREVTKYINLTDDNVAQFAQDALEYATKVTPDKTETPADAGDLTVTGLELGTYLVYPQGATDIVNPYGSICSLDSTTPNVDVVIKAEYPTVDKKIDGDTDTDDETTGKVENNTASIGSKVPYIVDGNVPDMTGYNYYYYILEDTLSAGLTFNNDVEVTIGGKALTKVDTPNQDITQNGETFTVTQDGQNIRIDLLNFIQYQDRAGAAIEVKYSATVNSNAVVGNDANTNTIHLKYSNDPSQTWNGTTPPPTIPDPEDVEGQSPDITTNTYVIALQLNKVDASGNDLTGAKFSISGTKQNVVVVNGHYYEADAAGTWYRLKDGTYTETAPTDLTKDKYEAKEDGTYQMYKEVTEIDKEYNGQEGTFEAEGWVDANGVLTFKGLGNGTYTINELVAPNGYNLLTDPITVTVSFDVANKKWTATKDGIALPDTAFTETAANGATFNVFEFDVVNQSGSLLPSTGGIGTTIFYVVGAVLVIGAGILLVTKKRMSVR